MFITCIAFLPLLFSIDATATDDDWPGWRGPAGNGVAKGSPPLEWSEEKNLRWKTPIPGKGSSSPVVWGDRIFVTTAVPTGKKAVEEPETPQGEQRGGRRGGMRSVKPSEHEFVVLAMKRADGSILWKKSACTMTPHQGIHRDGTFASPTPVTDGKVVIASFGSAGLYAYDVDGKPLWQKDLGDLDIAMSFGEGSSPVLHAEVLVVSWDHQGDSFIVALDRSSGEELWRREREKTTNWTTPLIVEGENGPQIIIQSASTIAYDLKTGKELWSYEPRAQANPAPRGGAQRGGRQGRSRMRMGNIASPTVSDGLLLLSTGSRGGALQAVRIAGAEGKIDPEEAVHWNHAGDTPSVPSLIAYRGILYAFKSNSGILSAFDIATGERLYGPRRLSELANIYASPVAADGRLYLCGRDGSFEVLAAGKEFKSLAVNKLDDGFDASPAIVGDEIILRGNSHVYCVARQ